MTDPRGAIHLREMKSLAGQLVGECVTIHYDDHGERTAEHGALTLVAGFGIMLDLWIVGQRSPEAPIFRWEDLLSIEPYE